MTEQTWLTSSEAASHLRISEGNLYTMRKYGRFPRPHRIGRLNRWHRQDLDRWVKSGCPIVDPEKLKQAELKDFNRLESKRLLELSEVQSNEFENA